MQDEDFIRGILAYPEDDAPRLVHADWLEEQGQAERAELIRLQCELARLPAGDSRRETLSQRERQLLDEYAYQWGEPLQDLVDEFDFRRGYVECVEIGYPGAVWNLDKICASVPLRYLRLNDSMLDFDIFAERASVFAGLCELDLRLQPLYGREGQKRLKQALGHTRFNSLTSLRVVIVGEAEDSWAGVDEELFSPLLENPWVTGLGELALDLRHFQDSGNRFITELAAWSGLRFLESLTLHGCTMSDETAEVIFEALARTQLRRLALVRCAASESAWRQILRLRTRCNLDEFCLDDSRVLGSDDTLYLPWSYPLWEELVDSFGAALTEHKEYNREAHSWHGYRWERSGEWGVGVESKG